MTKSEKAECLKLYTYKRMGADDIVARSLCTLIRSARTEQSLIDLRKQADTLEVADHPEYLDCMAQIGM